MNQRAAVQVVTDQTEMAEGPAGLSQHLADQGYLVHLFISRFSLLDAARLEQALRDDWGFIRARLSADPVTQTLSLEWEYPRKPEPGVSEPDALTGSFDVRFVRCTGNMKKVLNATSGGKGLLSHDDLWMDDRGNIDAMSIESSEMRSMLLLTISQDLPDHQCTLVQLSSDPAWFENMARTVDTLGADLPVLMGTSAEADVSAPEKVWEERARLFVVGPESLDFAALQQALLARGLISARLELDIDPTTHTLRCSWEAPANYVQEVEVPLQDLPHLSGVITLPFVRCPVDVRAVLQRRRETDVVFHSPDLWMDDAEDFYSMPLAAQAVHAALCMAIIEQLPEHRRQLVTIPIDPAFYQEQKQVHELLSQMEEDDHAASPFRTLVVWAFWALVAFTVIRFIARLF